MISNAFAQAPASPAGGGSEFLIMMVLMFVVMYFLIIRPQMKRAKEHKQVLEALQKGDEVVVAGGLVGKVVELSDQYVTLEVASGMNILVQRQAVQVPLPKGTIKSIK